MRFVATAQRSVRLAAVVFSTALASIFATFIADDVYGQPGYACVPIGWCGCPTCNNCPSGNATINCNVSPPQGFNWGGCGTSGTTCSQGSISCGGYRWTCDGTTRLTLNTWCNPQLSYCQ